MTIAIAGSRGQLGGELVHLLGGDAISLTQPDFDLLDPERCCAILKTVRPQILINAAAYTDVARAEDEPEKCIAVNATAVRALAETCEELACVFVQISTDYVFGAEGMPQRAYHELDQPDPHGVYARSKVQAEIFAQRCRRHLIIRTAGLYDSPRQSAWRRGRNFVETILSLAESNESIRVVNDHVCTPSYVPHIARAILYLAQKKAQGIFHLTNQGATTWDEFAREILRHQGQPTKVVPISRAEYSPHVPRPRYSVLDTTKYQKLGGPSLPDWRAALDQFFQDAK